MGEYFLQLIKEEGNSNGAENLSSGILKNLGFQYVIILSQFFLPVSGDNILTRDVLFSFIEERQKVIENEVHSCSDDFQVDNYNENLLINIDNGGRKKSDSQHEHMLLEILIGNTVPDCFKLIFLLRALGYSLQLINNRSGDRNLGFRLTRQCHQGILGMQIFFSFYQKIPEFCIC